MEKRQEYHKPQLRKVHLEGKISVLATCNSSAVAQAYSVEGNMLGCTLNQCFTPPPEA